MANPFAEFRKLMKVAKGSYYVVIPPPVIKKLAWRKLVVEEKDGGVFIRD